MTEDSRQLSDALLSLHKDICMCPKCKGTIDKTKLCASCREKDKIIDKLQPEVDKDRGADEL